MYLNFFDNNCQIFDHLKQGRNDRTEIACCEWELFHNREAGVALPGLILFCILVSRQFALGGKNEGIFLTTCGFVFGHYTQKINKQTCIN